jgi:hypothetical protein
MNVISFPFARRATALPLALLRALSNCKCSWISAFWRCLLRWNAAVHLFHLRPNPLPLAMFAGRRVSIAQSRSSLAALVEINNVLGRIYAAERLPGLRSPATMSERID